MKSYWRQSLWIGAVTVCVLGVLIVVTKRGPLFQRPTRLARPDYDALRIPSGDRERPSAATFRPGWAVDEQEAITDIRTVAADQVTHEVKGDELVLGVQIGGQARAYSINTMSGPHREIFNDVLADRPIAATW